MLNTTTPMIPDCIAVKLKLHLRPLAQLLVEREEEMQRKHVHCWRQVDRRAGEGF
ncbi:hypothetical protein NQZ68_017771 [Dissostichus eleginoides]|nr:hypothetical protein NQZ68_017771 [Dissostichus eleginoides]